MKGAADGVGGGRGFWSWDVIQIHQAGAWRRAVLGEGSVSVGLWTTEVGVRSAKGAQKAVAECTVFDWITPDHDGRILIYEHVSGLMKPCYHWWEIPYYWSGLKTYDFIAGSQGLTGSRFLTRGESKFRFPTLSLERSDGSSLKGSVRR